MIPWLFAWPLDAVLPQMNCSGGSAGWRPRPWSARLPATIDREVFTSPDEPARVEYGPPQSAALNQGQVNEHSSAQCVFVFTED